MSTLEKLDAYGKALSRWKQQKQRNDFMAADGKKTKPLDPEPSPVGYEMAIDDEWAAKVHDQIIGKQKTQIPMRKIKIPVRRTI